MEKIVVGKWYRHRGNKNSVPERVKNAPKNYVVVVRYRDGETMEFPIFLMAPEVWVHIKDPSDIMAYQFVEKK